MKHSRLLMFLLIVTVAVIGTSCGKKIYTFDFTTAANIDDWYLDDSFGGDYALIPGTGLELDHYGIASPKAFTGDFTMTVVFSLDVDEDNQVYFEIYPGDTKYWEPDNYIYSYFDYVGWLTEEEWDVEDVGPTDSDSIVDAIGTISDLDRKGENTWRLEKRGNSYKTYINDYKISDFSSTYCRGSKYYLSLYAYLDGGNIYFKSVNVEYTGSMVN